MHHVRDRTYREDDSKIRTGQLPRTMTTLRNLAISIHRQEDTLTIAAALRRAARDRPAPSVSPGPHMTKPDRSRSRNDPK
jgi:hypothetical protein